MEDVNSFAGGSNIPTVRRLDYMIKDTDPMESGYLYAAMRQLESLTLYLEPGMSDEYKEEMYNRKREVVDSKLDWVNEWMRTNGKEEIFNDIEDWRRVAADYDYFWGLRTKQQFIEEEVEARLGKSGRTPIEGIDEKYMDIIDSLVAERSNDDKQRDE